VAAVVAHSFVLISSYFLPTHLLKCCLQKFINIIRL